MRYRQMRISKELLFQVQQGLSVRLQHGVQTCAESPQVNPMKSRLVGLVCVMLLLMHMAGVLFYELRKADII